LHQQEYFIKDHVLLYFDQNALPSQNDPQ